MANPPICLHFEATVAFLKSMLRVRFPQAA